ASPAPRPAAGRRTPPGRRGRRKQRGTGRRGRARRPDPAPLAPPHATDPRRGSRRKSTPCRPRATSALIGRNLHRYSACHESGTVRAMNPRLATVILAAGLGTRMRSARAKVLHTVAGRPMIEYPVGLARALGSERVVLVLGHQADAV